MQTMEQRDGRIRELILRDDKTTYGDIAVGLQKLREEYRRRQKQFDGRTVQLAEMSQQFRQTMERETEWIADRLHQINESITRLELEKEFWRGELVRKLQKPGRCEFRGQAASIRVVASEIAAMPPAKSQERLRLEELVSRAGIWPSVSILSASKMHKAIVGGIIPADNDVDVRRLCPMTLRYQVFSRPIGSSS